MSTAPPTPSRRRLVATVLRSAAGHRLPLVAGEAAFFAALAVFPTLLTVVAVVRAGSAVLGPGADREAAAGLTSLLRVVLTTRGSAAADAATDLLAHRGGGLFTFGTVAALFLLVRALRSILFALAGVAERPLRRQWLRAVALAIATLVAAALVLAAAVQDPLTVLALPGALRVWDVLRWPMMAAALVAWAMLLLRVGLGRPPGPRRRRGLLVGACIAAGGWVGASLVFPLYVAVAARFTDTIGTLGGGLILLVWLYLLMLVLYLGAEVCVAMHRNPGRESGDRST